jgi:hypothetical protein
MPRRIKMRPKSERRRLVQRLSLSRPSGVLASPRPRATQPKGDGKAEAEIWVSYGGVG